MKRLPRPMLIFGCVFLLLAAWAAGFAMGNASASRCAAISALYKDSLLLKELEAGQVDRAQSHAELFIAANYRYINSRPFWISALSEHFEIDDDSLYERVSPAASATATNFFSKAIPVEQAIDDALEEIRKKENETRSP